MEQILCLVSPSSVVLILRYSCPISFDGFQISSDDVQLLGQNIRRSRALCRPRFGKMMRENMEEKSDLLWIVAVAEEMVCMVWRHELYEVCSVSKDFSI